MSVVTYKYSNKKVILIICSNSITKKTRFRIICKKKSSSKQIRNSIDGRGVVSCIRMSFLPNKDNIDEKNCYCAHMCSKYNKWSIVINSIIWKFLFAVMPQIIVFLLKI